MPSGLRYQVAQSLILLMNRKVCFFIYYVIDTNSKMIVIESNVFLICLLWCVLKSLVIEDLLALFLDIQTLGDKNLRKLAFSHIVQTIRKMSITDPRHKSLHKIVFSMLEVFLFSFPFSWVFCVTDQCIIK